MINGASPPTHPAMHPIAKFLEEKKIHTVAVIDDAFDDRRTFAELISGETRSFWERIEFDEEARTALDSHSITLENELDVERDEILQQLWEVRDDPTRLGTVIREVLFPAVIEKHTFLTELVKRLGVRLGLTVHTYGRDIEVDKAFKDKEVQLVFLDFIMGPESNINESVKSSKNIARQIYKNHIGRRMPLVILMSNAGTVYERSTEFRKSSGLLSGMFYVVHKDELASEEKVFLNIGMWSKALPLGADLQSFINTLQTSIKSASIKFMNGIKELSLEDYRYIQRLSLLEDGQPLGDYLIGLYSAYLGHLLFERDEALRAQRKLVDELAAHYPPPGDTMPSMQLVKMYHTSLFELEGTGGAGFDLSDENTEDTESEEDEEVERSKIKDNETGTEEAVFGAPVKEPLIETQGHLESAGLEPVVKDDSFVEANTREIGAKEDILDSDRIIDEDDLLDLYEHMYRNSGSGFPRSDSYGQKRDLRLGDVFILEQKSQAMLIINADCDLAIRPNNTCESDDSIYLLPGKLYPLKVRVSDADEKKKRTELFAFSGEKYRIVWDIKKVTTLTFSEVQPFLEKSGYVWKARLRQPYALELQRTFAADLTRIGMPVPPPIYQPIGIEFLGRVDTSSWVSIMSETDNLAVVVMKGGKTKCYPTKPFSYKMRESLGRLIQISKEHQQQLLDSGAAQAELDKIKRQITSLNDFNSEFETWFCRLEELVLPVDANKIGKVPNMPAIGVSWNLVIGDKPDSNKPDNKSPIFMINIAGLEESPTIKKKGREDEGSGHEITADTTGTAPLPAEMNVMEIIYPDAGAIQS